jgi:hypothetical protein
MRKDMNNALIRAEKFLGEFMGYNKKYQHQYYLVHRNELLPGHRISAKKHREKRIQDDPDGYRADQRKRKRKWDRKAMKDPLHRLSNNIRGNMHHALKAKKAGRKWEDLVGYTLQDLINHIDPLLGENMTWENYGSVWHVDHITPKSWFKYSDANDPQFKACWALTNLQPKLKIDNIKKGNRFRG